MRVRLLAVVAVAAALFRLVYFLEVRDEPSFSLPQVDAADYHGRAQQVMRGEGLGPQAYYKAPAYSWLVGQIYRLTGPHPETIYVLQMLGGVLLAGLVAQLGMRWCGPAVGVVAGLAAGLYPRLVYYETQLLVEPAALVVSTLAVALLARTTRSWAVLAAGLLSGVALQLRPLNGLFVLALLLWLVHGADRRLERWRRSALLVAPVLLLLLPTLRHNRLATGRFVPISLNGGINFYIGNNLDYDNTVAIRPGLRWEELTQRFDSRDDPVQWEKNYYAAAWHSVRAAPLRHAALTLKKVALVWNGREIDRNQDSAPLRQASRLLRGPGVSWGVLAIGGLVGLGLIGQKPPLCPPLPLLVWLQVLGVVAFFVTSRYRLCLVPWLALATGLAAVQIAGALWRREGRRLILLGAAFVAAALIVLPDWTGLERHSFGRPEFDRAMVLARRGEREAALSAYQKAVQQHPDDPDVVYRYGEHLELMGRRGEAIRAYAQAAALAPGSYKPCLSLGAAYMLEDSLDAAWTAFAEAERRGDPSGRTAYDMGLVRERQGRFEEAAALFERSLARADEKQEVAARHLAAARCLVRLQRAEAAEVHFRAAETMLRQPALVPLERAEAWLRAGEATRALALLQTVPGLDRNARGQAIRARALEVLGRRTEAEEAARRALQLEPQSEAYRRLLQVIVTPR